MSDAPKKQLNEYIQQAFSDYGIVIACLFIGMFMGWHFKLFFADRKYNNQVKLRINEKYQQIVDLKSLVHEKLDNVVVDTRDKSFFDKVKKYFKKSMLINIMKR